MVLDIEVTISLEKINLHRKKERFWAIFICAHFMRGLRLGVGLTCGVKS